MQAINRIVQAIIKCNAFAISRYYNAHNLIYCVPVFIGKGFTGCPEDLYSRKVIRVTGLYRQPGMAQDTFWIGWFGLRPAFRRRGYGKKTIRQLIEIAQTARFKTLWVLTGATDDPARKFYRQVGFEIVGPAKQCSLGMTADDSDKVLPKGATHLHI